MGSVIEGTMALMGLIGGLMLAYMGLRASEPRSVVSIANKKVRSFSENSHKKAA